MQPSWAESLREECLGPLPWVDEASYLVEIILDICIRFSIPSSWPFLVTIVRLCTSQIL